MSESLSSPWIRDYFINVAETHGAQLFNTPASSGKKKVQFTDFLTYQENSYIWAWISDKDYRVSVRIAQDAADEYKRSNHGRNIVDCRFSVVSISNYRPMFSPRPLGPKATGNTPVSHVSLEIGHVRSVGVGGHLFGNPRDLESDENMKEWVSGLRQDGGGGNVLKLRKQQELARNKNAPPSPPPFSLYAPVSQCQAIKPAEDIVKPKPEQPQDFKRAYAKRWRTIEVNPWKFTIKPASEERPNQTEPRVLVEPRSATTSKLESRHRDPLACVTSPLRTPSPTSGLQRQGTPTDWSPSNRGSPVAPDRVTTNALGDGSGRRDEPEVLPTTPRLPSDTEGHATADTVINSDTHSLQPPTPAQRIKRSPPLHSSPEVIARSSPLPSHQLPGSSPPPPSSSLPPLSSSLPMPMSFRKSIQRKVPHPGPVARPDPTKNGPVQILVPNSETSGTGSSQSYSQSQLPSQSQQFQRQLLSRSRALPSSLANDFKPPDTSTPREGKPGSSTRHMSKMFAESLPTRCNVNEKEMAFTGEKCRTDKPETNIGKQEGLDLTQPPEVLEVGTSDTEEETEQLQLTCITAQTEDEFDTQTGKQDTGKREVGTGAGGNHLSVDEVEVHSAAPNSPPHRPSCQPAASVIQHPSSNKQETDNVSTHQFLQSPERPVSRSSMHSLFSDLLEDGRAASSHVPVSQIEVKVQENATAHVARHDAEAWKEPSFLARKKGKGKILAAQERDTPSVEVGKKRQRSAEPASPVRKRASEGRRVASGHATIENVQPQDIDAPGPATGKTRSSNRPPTDTIERMTSPTAFQSSQPRLANLVVDFRKIDLGKRVPVPMVDIDKDIKGTLLRTGRIRTLGQKVEKDGSVYIMRR